MIRPFMFRVFCLLIFICILPIRAIGNETDNYDSAIKVGAERIDIYLPLIFGKEVGIVANHTSLVKQTHLVDTLLALGVKVKKIFSPEHGFRGDAEAGEHFHDGIDSITGLHVISLYGKNFKPKKEDLLGLDVLIFDIQDVGVRFYTYISTLHYTMEACAENNLEMIVLDRPNPNGFYFDGPLLNIEHKSFVGLHPIPVIYGLTIGELAMMINGERWLNNDVTCKLSVINCENYTHSSYYKLPVNPSPNLQNMASVYLYPSICFFEGTIVSVGRGTDSPFRVIGFPGFPDKTFSFIPRSIDGFSKNPLYKDSICYGINLTNIKETELQQLKRINLSYLLQMYNSKPDSAFFIDYFDLLSGNNELKEQIINGLSENEIRSSWRTELENYKTIREKYLLYPDFE